MHVVGTAGHVDHGKSTLVRALTGIDPDRFEEEKRRGLTIDLGFAWCSLPSGREIGIVDVPGHERFIRNMLAGVGGIDAAIFVVAADEGWMPQSAEHLQILDFLDVHKGVVALSKCDLVDDDMIALVTEDIALHTSGTALEKAPVVPVSALTRDGLDDLLAVLDEQLGDHAPSADGRPRMFVDRSFTIGGAGTVVTGTLTGGRLRVGDEVTVLPYGNIARIRTLQTHRESVEEARPGSRVAANLVGLERRSIRRGDALVTDAWMLSKRFAGRLRTALALDHALSERGAYELFVGSAQTRCRLKFLEGGSELGPGASVVVEAFCGQALPIVPGDRFVVRDVGRWETVAGGTVIDQAPPRLRRTDDDALDRLRAREGLGGAALAAQVIMERRALPYEELEALTGVGTVDIDEAIDGAADRVTSSYVVSIEHARTLLPRTLAALEEFHDAHPLDAGLSVDDLCRTLEIDRAVAGEYIGEWQRAGVVAKEGNVVRLPQQGAQLTEAQRADADRALAALRNGGTSPPGLRELGVPLSLAKALERAGELVLVTPDIAYPADIWSEIRQRVVELITKEGPATVARAREAIGTSRKYAVPLLEHLDAEGITRRNGDVRELGPRGKELSTGLE